MSKQVARQKAERTVKTFYLEEKKRIDLTPAEWGERVRAEAERLFDEGGRSVKISPAFDAPHFCRDWIAVAPAEVRDTRIMARAPKLDEKEKPIVRKGQTVMTWAPWEPKKA